MKKKTPTAIPTIQLVEREEFVEVGVGVGEIGRVMVVDETEEDEAAAAALILLTISVMKLL